MGLPLRQNQLAVAYRAQQNALPQRRRILCVFGRNRRAQRNLPVGEVRIGSRRTGRLRILQDSRKARRKNGRRFRAKNARKSEVARGLPQRAGHALDGTSARPRKARKFARRSCRANRKAERRKPAKVGANAAKKFRFESLRFFRRLSLFMRSKNACQIPRLKLNLPLICKHSRRIFRTR